MSEPVFSIGVPTYNRRGLLKQTLASLLAQTSGDFEILVGNDYVPEPLTPESLGIDDKRVRIINHRNNLGELGNMNALLAAARGRYFTWQFDDDLAAPGFLESVSLAYKSEPSLKCVFTSYAHIYGVGEHRLRPAVGTPRLLSGREFLRGYLSGRLRAMGCCGVFDTGYLRGEGGARRLSETPMAIHAEYLLLFRAGLQPVVGYIDAPLVASRIHNTSWSASNKEVAMFRQAGQNLIRESLPVFLSVGLRDDFEPNLQSVLNSVIGSIALKLVASGKKVSNSDIAPVFSHIREYFDTLLGTPHYEASLKALVRARENLWMYSLIGQIKLHVPAWLFSFIHRARPVFSRCLRKSF